ncbi:globin [Polymorphobacter arshaanensis]|uniref:Globin n=1 Tax=Glacieibacterium arshaanense TaxID=2511025 RepID=A0A4Y9ERW9_9SPHN|nr:group II truncated hemoglobin [Polymorphobacter arshaanensis]TFU05929.1 globin [Polymorphobacter arshaanensis]
MTVEVATKAPAAPTPFELFGGAVAVRKLVDRFYDLMEGDPDYAALRALHAADLDPMRDSLTGFLIAWLGGPRDWFDARPGGPCVMSMHRKVAIDSTVADQWLFAMSRALDSCAIDAPLRSAIITAFTRMAGGMVNR